MASFTDDLINFNPYIQELPVDDMVRVGMMKQEQYNQGVKQVQGMIDSIAGLNVVEKYKPYLDARLGQLTSEIGKVAGGDFSKAQLVSSIGGLTGQIASDKIIRNAVGSTAKYQSAVAKMEKAKSEGKSNPANERELQRDVERWLNDGDLTTEFKSDYQEFYDINKRMEDVINEIRKTPGETLRQNPYRIDPETGKTVINEAMIQEESKGVSPQKIRDAVASVLSDPRAQRQAGINARYRYEGMDKKALFEENKANYQSALDTNQKKVAELTTTANNGTDAERRIALAHLKEIQNQTSEMITAYNKDVDVLDKNPEAFKVSLYTRNLAQEQANLYSYVNESTKIMTNPLWSAYTDMLDYNLKVKQYDLDVLSEERRAMEATLAGARKAKPGEEDSIFDTPTKMPVPTEGLEAIGRGTYMAKLEEDEKAHEAAMKDYIFMQRIQDPLTNPYIKLPNGEFRYKSKENGDESAFATDLEAKIAAGNIYLEGKKGFDQRTTRDAATVKYFSERDNEFNNVRERRRKAEELEKAYAPQLKKAQQEMSQKGIPETITFKNSEGKDMTVRAIDLFELSTGDDASKKNVESRLGTDAYKALQKELAGGDSYGSVVGGASAEFAFGPSPTVPRALQSYLEKVKSLSSLPDAKEALANREKDYQALQNEFVNYSAPFKTNEAKLRQSANTFFRSVLQNRSIGSGGVGEDIDVDDVLTRLNDDLKEGKGRLVYSYYRDRRNNQSYLTLSEGDGENLVKIPITDDQAMAIPQVDINDEFYNIFGKRFLGERSTDKGSGRATAISFPGTDALQNYNVKVHLNETGGAYAIKMYIFDKQTGQWTDNVPVKIPRMDLLTQEQVMAYLSNLNDSWVDGILGKTNQRQ